MKRMSKTYKDIYNQFRGDVPLRGKQVHKDKRRQVDGGRGQKHKGRDWE